MPKKMKYEDLAAAYSSATKENTVLAIALQEVVLGNVQWLRSGCFSAGIVRPTSACGGIVIIRWRCKGQADTISAHYMDDWLAHWRNSPPVSGSKRDHREFDAGIHLCELVTQARYRALEAEKAAFDAAVPIVTRILDGMPTDDLGIAKGE